MTTNGEGDIDVVDFGPNIHVSAHPIIYHKISILRSSATKAGTFRSVLRELTHHLGYEATKGLKTRTIPVSVNVGKHGKSDKNNGTTTMTSTSDNGEIHKDCTGHKISTRVALIPILRSGLGMADGFLELLPKAAVHHIGMYHIPGSAPVQYFNRLPRKCESEVAFVVDPVIGSGETIMAVIAILKKWGVPTIHIISVLASKTGLEKIKSSHPDIYLTIGVVDETLTKTGLVVPGLGDAGDRLFGTDPIEEHDDESLLHPSKRKRSDA